MRMLLVVGCMISSAAFAGKREREFKATEMDPAVKAAQEAYQKSCGCKLTIKAADNLLTTEDDMRLVRSTSNSITAEAAKHCTDKESKAAMCKMNTLVIEKKKGDTKFEFAGSKGTAWTDGNSYVSFGMMVDQIDK